MNFIAGCFQRPRKSQPSRIQSKSGTLFKRFFTLNGVPYEYDELLASEKPKAKLLAEILSLILEYPGSWVLEMDLIHHVCQRYPQSVPTSRVDVNCACLETHVVSPRGIVLLERLLAILGLF